MTPTHPRGFTLLIAVLVAGILLSLGFAIFNIVSKDILLSSSGRESLSAFYAADSGVECALYADKNNQFSTSSPQIPVCRGQIVADYSTEVNAGFHTTRFTLSLGAAPAAPCALVRVVRYDQPGEQKTTTIYSSGYNTCTLTNPRRTERALRVDY